MNPMQWKARSMAYSGISLFVIYFLVFYKWSHHLVYTGRVKNSKAEHVWEFVADFGNMMKLNPTIEHFSVTDDFSSYDEWKYSVHYTEHFHSLPMFRNNAHGTFIVKSKDKVYMIESKHRTCFILGLSCLNSDSEFIFESEGQDTNCLEKIKYECPLIFSILCHNEIMFQRKEILKNLQTHFLTTNLN